MIPKYAGFVPEIRSESLFGRTSTELSRAVFRPQLLDSKPNLFASTGFNSIRLPRSDGTMQATSQLFGQSTTPATHPCLWVRRIISHR